MEREKQIRSRTQQKHDIESNWKKAVNFIPLSGEIVVYDDVKNIKIGDGKTKINDLDFFFSNNSFDDNLIIDATPETLISIMKSAKPNTIINLLPGNYERLFIIGKDSFPENLTLNGQKNKTIVNGMTISSGVISETVMGNSDVSGAILSSGLTIQNITFTSNLSQMNSRIDNLTIDNCDFINGANITINPESFVGRDGDKDRSERYTEGKTGTMYRFPYMHVRQKNTTIKNCLVEDSTIPSWGGGITSAINILGVEGINVYKNIVNKSKYNGISIGGQVTTNGYDVVSRGKITVTDNNLNNTVNRSMNIFSIHNGEIVVAGNTLTNANTGYSSITDVIAFQNCKETLFNWFKDSKKELTNKYNGTIISTDDLIRFYNIPQLLDSFNRKPRTYIASSSKLSQIIAEAEPGAIVQLKKGSYNHLILRGKDSFPENLTIIGEEGAVIAGIEVNSGVGEYDKVDSGATIMPSGLTFKNLTFSQSLRVFNSQISNVGVIGCTFQKNASLVFKPCNYGESTIRKGIEEVMGNNILISNCIFEESDSREEGAVILQAVRDVVIENNTINSSPQCGILVSGVYGSQLKAGGTIVINKNKIKNSTLESIKLWFLEQSLVYVLGNNIENSGAGAILLNNCKSTASNYSLNTLNGVEITPDSGIVEESCSTPADYIKTQIGFSAALNLKADKTELDKKADKSELTGKVDKSTFSTNMATKMDNEPLTYNAADEAALETWVDNTVLPGMKNNSMKNICIKCGSLIPYEAAGTIHKLQNNYVIIDVIMQIHGKRFIKIKNSTWGSLTCETDKLNTTYSSIGLKLDKKVPFVYYASDETSLEYWLENTVLPNMADGSVSFISFKMPPMIIYEATGTIHKNASGWATIEVTMQVNGNKYMKVKNGSWGPIKSLNVTAASIGALTLADLQAREQEIVNKVITQLPIYNGEVQ